MTKEARIYNGEKTVPSINGAGKTGQPHEIRTLPNTIQKNKLEMDLRSKYKTRYYKTPSGKHQPNPL